MNRTSIITQGVPAETATGTWRIDPAHTAVTFSVRHLMSKVRGQFSEVDGRIVIGSSLETCSVVASIPMASVHTGIRSRDDDLRSPNFFDAEQFSSMRFTSNEIRANEDEIALVGTLEIRGVSRPVTIDVDFLGLDESGLQGERRIGFAGHTTVRRKDFGVGDSAVEGSKVVVGDVVTIELDVEAFLEG